MVVKVVDCKNEQPQKADLGAKIRKFGLQRSRKKGGIASAFASASVMGFHLLSGMLVGGFIGYWLDRWLDTGPWMKVIFFVFGVAAGFRNMYQDAMLLLARQDKKDDGKVNGGANADNGKPGATD